MVGSSAAPELRTTCVADDQGRGTPVTGSTITVSIPTAEGGRDQLEAYLVTPSGEVNGGVVVIHEIWGMQDHFRDVADRFADLGYVAIAPDVLSRVGIDPASGAELARLRFEATEEERSREQPRLREAFSASQAPEYTAWAVTALQAVVDVVAGAAGVDGRIAVTGYCFGGGLSFQLAAADDRIRAAIPYYGRAPEPDTLARITAPVLAFYGSLDEPLMATLPQLRADAAAAGVEFEAVVYDGAKHAFFNDTNATTYDADAAADSWRRSTEFLARHLNPVD